MIHVDHEHLKTNGDALVQMKASETLVMSTAIGALVEQLAVANAIDILKSQASLLIDDDIAAAKTESSRARIEMRNSLRDVVRRGLELT